MGISFMLCRGQNCEFCHIESRGKNNVPSLIKLQSTSIFFSTQGAYFYIVFISACYSLKKKKFQDLKNWHPSYYCTFFLTHPVYVDLLQITRGEITK